MPCAYNLLIFLIRLLATWFVVDEIWFNKKYTWSENSIGGENLPTTYYRPYYRSTTNDYILPTNFVLTVKNEYNSKKKLTFYNKFTSFNWDIKPGVKGVNNSY